MPSSRLALLPLVVIVLAACSANGGSSVPPASASSAPSGAPEATRIEVQLTDALAIEPATMRVPAGVPVTFVVTNTGTTDHEFYLGDEEAQAAHAEEMQAMGGMAHDQPMGMGVGPGETKELTVTFPAGGTMLAGCHVAGHYEAGMKATVEVAG